MKRVLDNVVEDNFDIVESSGNVFSDIGVTCSPEEMAKMQIAIAICKTIKKKKLTQIRAAEILKTDQSKISSISRGKISGFSIERLLTYLILLGIDIDILLKKGKNNSGKITVLSKAA